jgi:hypothetical protein
MWQQVGVDRSVAHIERHAQSLTVLQDSVAVLFLFLFLFVFTKQTTIWVTLDCFAAGHMTMLLTMGVVVGECVYAVERGVDRSLDSGICGGAA